MRLSWVLLLAAAVANAEESAIHAAARAGDIEAVRAAIAGGAAVDARDETGRTALHVAAESGRDGVARALLHAGAAVNAVTHDGRTPADLAAGKGYAAVLAVVFDAGGVKIAGDMESLLASARATWLPAAVKIASCGKDIIPSLLDLASNTQHEWQEDRIASVIWGLGAPIALDILPHLSHENPHVRSTIATTLTAWARFEGATLEPSLDAVVREPGSAAALRRLAQLAWRYPHLVQMLPAKSKEAICLRLEGALDSAEPLVRQAALAAAAACGAELNKPGRRLVAKLRRLGADLDGDPELTPQARWANAAITSARGVIGNPYGRAARAAEEKSDRRREVIQRAVRWLLSHQRENGSWQAEPRFPQYDVGVTALALLALLGAGDEQPFDLASSLAIPLRRGLAFLLVEQGENGAFGPQASDHFPYGHAMATLALAEALILGGPPGLRKPLGDAVAFITAAQTPGLGWRYATPPNESDTSVTRWMFGALRSAWFAGMAVDGRSLLAADHWVSRMTDPETCIVGYMHPGGSCARPEGLENRFPVESSCSMVAAGITIRLLTSATTVIASDRMLPRQGTLCLKCPPTHFNPQARDYYYWYLGSEAMALMGQSYRNKWDLALRNALFHLQREDGSFDADDVWSGEGGPVYATAIATMSLQAAYRDR